MLPLRKILSAFHLGALTKRPVYIKGQLTHKVWRVETTKGIFAIKALNLQVLQLLKETLLPAVVSERIAAEMKNHHIPAVLALQGDTEMLWAQRYRVFPWVKGVVLSLKEISLDQVFQMGQVLRKIHEVQVENFQSLPSPNWVGLKETLWKGLCQQALNKQLPWSGLLESYSGRLMNWSRQAAAAKILLRKSLVVGHRDLDVKNVIWHENGFTLIDWEYAGLTYPQVDLLAVAMNWAGIAEGYIDEARFVAVLKGYHLPFKIDEAVLGGYLGYCMDWLIFNLRYGELLGCPCDRVYREIQSTLKAMDLVVRFFV